MSAPLWSVVTISPYVWLRPEPPPTEGDVLVTPAGSCYEILDARLIRGHTHRFHFVCLKRPPDDLPADARLVPLVWFPRRPRRRP